MPISVFVHRETGEVLRDPAVNARIIAAFEAEGADAWFAEGATERFLDGLVANRADYEQVTDILDVWFDSGSTHAFVLEDRDDLRWPADLYLEGSDQHRGWFQSSLLESCGTRGRAPYDAVVTHGFVVDEEGRKMSKSLGNTVTPQEVIAQSGADILRLWVVSSDYAEDLRIGPEILKNTVESYRKIRNTLRWMLGTLTHFTPSDVVDEGEMPELERLILSRLSGLDEEVRAAYDAFDFKRITASLSNFMTVELSAYYFDIRKDALYCSDLERQAPGGADGDRPAVRPAGQMVGAASSLHHGGGLGSSPWRGCCLGASNSVSDNAAELARRGAGAHMGTGVAGAFGHHRGAGARTGAETDRLVARGGTSSPCRRSGAPCRIGRYRSRGDCHHLGRRAYLR